MTDRVLAKKIARVGTSTDAKLIGRRPTASRSGARSLTTDSSSRRPTPFLHPSTEIGSQLLQGAWFSTWNLHAANARNGSRLGAWPTCTRACPYAERRGYVVTTGSLACKRVGQPRAGASCPSPWSWRLIVARGRVNVLMYHDVIENVDRADESGFPGRLAATYKVCAPRFEQHLDAIAARTRGRAPTILMGLDASAEGWCLTFDDGGLSAVTHISEVLERRGWRGYFFVTTGRLNTPGFLTSDEVREIAKRGHVIGSHTESHPKRLSTCARQTIRDEWRGSVGSLSEIVGTRIVHASVPNGAYSHIVAEEAAEAGIRVLFTSEPSRNVAIVGTCLVVGRYSVRATTSAKWVAAVAAGVRSPRYRQWLEWRMKELAKQLSNEQYDRIRRKWRSNET